MRCTICGEEGRVATEYDPEEACLCGELAFLSPWRWYGWRGVAAWFCYRLASLAMSVDDWLRGVGSWLLGKRRSC